MVTAKRKTTDPPHREEGMENPFCYSKNMSRPVSAAGADLTRSACGQVVSRWFLQPVAPVLASRRAHSTSVDQAGRQTRPWL